MNIISGKFRGRKLVSLDTEKTKPTLNRIKESIFNVIADIIPNSVCCDLFAGSGALGIEALSRGARRVYFNDSNPDSRAIIVKNLRGDTEGAVILNADYLDAVNSIKEKLDIVFIDPPYDSDFGEKAIIVLAKFNKLANGATIVFEHSSKKSLQSLPKGCIINKTKTYGNKSVSFINYEVGDGR